MRLLVDENVAAHFQAAIVQAIPHLTILRVGEQDAPPKGTLDPEFLPGVSDTTAFSSPTTGAPCCLI
jgi:hypothetical protein